MCILQGGLIGQRILVCCCCCCPPAVPVAAAPCYCCCCCCFPCSPFCCSVTLYLPPLLLPQLPLIYYTRIIRVGFKLTGMQFLCDKLRNLTYIWMLLLTSGRAGRQLIVYFTYRRHSYGLDRRLLLYRFG